MACLRTKIGLSLHLIETKTELPQTITNEVADSLECKNAVFTEITGIDKAVHIVMVTAKEIAPDGINMNGAPSTTLNLMTCLSEIKPSSFARV